MPPPSLLKVKIHLKIYFTHRIENTYPSFYCLGTYTPFWTINPGKDQFAYAKDLPTVSPLILPFKYGRVDAATCDDSKVLPSINLDQQGIMKFFNSKFKLTIAETVAIMGAHTLGAVDASSAGHNLPSQG